mmetsp:Transcript_903/g.1865  ORF Transcript_903/g.1865 Transcript_903/m.1865 type:complete len:102 (-) Transcript_903:206-511(-)
MGDPGASSNGATKGVGGGCRPPMGADTDDGFDAGADPNSVDADFSRCLRDDMALLACSIACEMLEGVAGGDVIWDKEAAAAPVAASAEALSGDVTCGVSFP